MHEMQMAKGRSCLCLHGIKDVSMQNREKATFYTCLNSFEGENFRKLVKNTIAVDKTFVNLACFCRAKDTMPTNFAEKTFANSHKTVKFTKVFSLESFSLYGK